MAFRCKAKMVVNFLLDVVVHFSTVLVIDSGIGGISIVKQMQNLSDKLATIYIADNAYFPYGNLSPELILSRLQTLIRTVQSSQKVDAVVIGCNTATVLMIDKLREAFDIPFVGIVPAVKTAAQVSKNRKFTLLATDNTAYSPYINDLIDEFAKDCNVLRVGCPGLADIAEAKIYGKTPVKADIQAVFNRLDESSQAHINASDVILLGCTHYAFLLEELSQCVASHQQIIEPSLPVAKRLMWVLENQKQYSDKKSAVQKQTTKNRDNHFYFTQAFATNDAFSAFLQAHHFKQAEVLL